MTEESIELFHMKKKRKYNENGNDARIKK